MIIDQVQKIRRRYETTNPKPLMIVMNGLIPSLQGGNVNYSLPLLASNQFFSLGVSIQKKTVTIPDHSLFNSKG
jgi:hypothetical protein